MTQLSAQIVLNAGFGKRTTPGAATAAVDVPFVLPMAQGSRPLFAGRALFERIMRRASEGNAWAAATRSQTLGWSAALRVAYELLVRRSTPGAGRIDDELFSAIKNLPLTLSFVDAQRWEIKRPWAEHQYRLTREHIERYARHLASDAPSDAYLTPSSLDDVRNTVWKTWLETAGTSELKRTFIGTAELLEKWDSHRPLCTSPGGQPEQLHCESSSDHLRRNIQKLSAIIGLDNSLSNAWYALELLGAQCPEEVGKVWLIASSDLAGPEVGTRLFGLWESALNLPHGSMSAATASGGLLKELQFFKGQGFSSSAWNLAQTWPAKWSAIAGDSPRESLASEQINGSLPTLPFLTSLPFRKTDDLPLSSWHGLGDDTRRALAALRSGRSVKLLVWGAPGTGKSALAASLIHRTNAVGWTPRAPTDAKGIDLSSFDKVALSAAKSVAQLSNALLLIDSCESLWNGALTKEILAANSVQIWTASSLEGASAEVLAGFDVVIQMLPMSTMARTKIATSRFPDKDVAFRVARSLRTPKEILATARWCQTCSDFSWECAKSYIEGKAAAMRARSTKKLGGFDLVDQDAATLQPLTGSPALQDLLARLTDMFLHPATYAALGAAAPRGVLLLGPPGCGKTLFARHLAQVASVPMLCPVSADLAASPERIKDLFNQARRIAPCLIFLDEADVLLGSPITALGPNTEKQRIVNAILAEMDGIDTLDGVLVIAATHRRLTLDPAAMRSGRFGETVHIVEPVRSERAAIWRAHLADRPVDAKLNISELSQASGGFSGAEIADAVNRASLIAARSRRATISRADLIQACDEVFWGPASGSDSSDQARRQRVSVHEAGHALLAWHIGRRVQRMSARPRGQTLGAVHSPGKEGERHGRREMLERVSMMLGGIAAETVLFGEFESGGTSDLERSRDELRFGITRAGLGIAFHAMSAGPEKEWSEARTVTLETEEAAEMKLLFEDAVTWLGGKRHVLSALACALLEAGEISGKDLDFWEAWTTGR